MTQPTITLCRHSGIWYAEFEDGRHGARGTGTSQGEALLSLMRGSQAVIGITLEYEAPFMPPPAEAACEPPDARNHVPPSEAEIRLAALKLWPFASPQLSPEMAEQVAELEKGWQVP